MVDNISQKILEMEETAQGQEPLKFIHCGSNNPKPGEDKSD